MERAEAELVLGVGPDADPDAVRSVYRRLIRDRHPDRAGSEHTAAAARIIEAYEVLRRAPAARPERPGRTDPPVPDASTSTGRPGSVEHDGPAVSVAAEAALRLLLDAAHDLGEVTYVDLSAGLIELVVVFEGGPVCQLLLSLHRHLDRVHAHVAVESLDATPPPPVADVTALLADLVRRRAEPTAG